MLQVRLTNRRPIAINEDLWPIIAEAKREWYNSQHKFQATRWWTSEISVRRHKDDGRAIVSASYCYRTQWAEERDEEVHRGEILPSGSDMSAVEEAIRRVCNDLSESGAKEVGHLQDECLASLPAERV